MNWERVEWVLRNKIVIMGKKLKNGFYLVPNYEKETIEKVKIIATDFYKKGNNKNLTR